MTSPPPRSADQPSVGDLVADLEALAPTRLAADWDNVGLLLGERGRPVSRLLTCLTLTPEVADEAVGEKADLVVTHHPILFRGAKRLTSDTPEGRMLLALAAAGVAVYSPHTAFDNAPGGINDLLADFLGLSERAPLRPLTGTEKVKVVTFVPDRDLGPVSDALFAAGAGHIGEYRECSFRVSGTGTFFGLETTNPTVGEKGRREEAAEWRLEVVCPTGRLADALAALRRAHSYEEPAYDVYPLRAAPTGQGEGRMGTLPQPTPLGELAARLKAHLLPGGEGTMQVVGDLDRPVRRAAIVCGAGGSLYTDARRAGAEVFLTGEMRFHDYLAARADGVGLILPGHYATERCGVEALARRLGERWPGLTVWASRRETDPSRRV
jgi:dinuclear metal center YbgI/SA1388 family protein